MGEEFGITVDRSSLHIVGTQPWPIGRAEQCDLMIGVMATATSTEISLSEELEDARWFNISEVRSMLSSTYPLSEGQLGVPGQYAIAWHLISGWERLLTASER